MSAVVEWWDVHKESFLGVSELLLYPVYENGGRYVYVVEPSNIVLYNNTFILGGSRAF